MENNNSNMDFLKSVTQKIVDSQAVMGDEIIKLVVMAESLLKLVDALHKSEAECREELANIKGKLKKLKSNYRDLEACYDMLFDYQLEPVNCENDNNEDDTLQGYVMQEKCVHCGREQYAPNVFNVSTGTARCVWCYRFSEKMTETEYLKALKKLEDDNSK